MSTSRKGKRVAVVLATVVVVGLPLAAWQYWPHLRFWYLFESMGPNDQGFPEYKHRQTGIIMVRLPGGTFWMGAPGPGAEGDNEPIHEVELRPFLLQKHRVTRPLGKILTGGTSFRLWSRDRLLARTEGAGIKGLCRKTGLKLPTRLQWEYAGGAGTPSDYIGQQERPNGFGLHQMCGPVVLARSTDDATVRRGAESDVRSRDPVGLGNSGSWIYTDQGWYIFGGPSEPAWYSGPVPPVERYEDIYFRLVYYPLPD